MAGSSLVPSLNNKYNAGTLKEIRTPFILTVTMASHKCRDGLLYYQGRPSLHYPAVLVEKQKLSHPRTLVTDLGMCKILCAVFLFVCGVVSIASDLSSSYGAGIWASVIIVINGVLAVAVGRAPESNVKWVAFFVATLLCEVSTGFLTVFSTIGLTRSIAGSDKFNSNKKNLLITAYSILLALALIDSVLSLICFVITMRKGFLCTGKKEIIKSEQRDTESSCSSSVPITKNDGLDTPRTAPYLVNQVDSDESEIYRALDKRLALDYLEKSDLRNK